MKQAPKHYFPFQESYEYQTVVPEPVGRIILGNGDIVRIVFTPQGLKMSVSSSAIRDGYIVVNNNEGEVSFPAWQAPNTPEGK
jgi:hypothetical protein